MRRRPIHGLPLGIEGVRITPSIRGLIRDIAGILRRLWSR